MALVLYVPPQKTSRTPWSARFVFGLAMVFTGAAGLVYEYVLSTELSYLLGGSIMQFSVTIGIMFFTMGIGGWVQNLIPKALAEAFIGAELLLVLMGGFSPLVLQWTYIHMPDDFGWIKFVYPALIGLLTGMEIPLMMRINKQFAKNIESNIASTWAWDYIGGALGVVGWVWALLHYSLITSIAFVTAGLNLSVALLTLLFFWRKGVLCRPRLTGTGMLLGTVATAMAVLLGAANAESWSRSLRHDLYDDPIVLHEQTPYQEIVVTKGPHPSNPQESNWELYLNGNKQFASSDEKIYHENLVHPAMNLASSRENVLVLGGGDGMAVREILKYQDVRNVTLVDLDPGMIKLARDNELMRKLNGNAFSDARVKSSLDDRGLNAGVTDTGKKQDVLVETGEMKNVDCEEVVDSRGRRVTDCDAVPEVTKTASVNVYTVDADKFVSSAAGRYGVVVIDLPDPNSVELAKLYSREFYSKVRQVLVPDGIVVVQATSPYHARETFLCIQRTMAAAGLSTLPYHANVPSFGDWGWMLGSSSLSETNLRERAESLARFDVPTEKIDVANFKAAMTFPKGDLTANNDRISTVMDPVIFGYYEQEAWLTD